MSNITKNNTLDFNYTMTLFFSSLKRKKLDIVCMQLDDFVEYVNYLIVTDYAGNNWMNHNANTSPHSSASHSKQS